MTDDEIIVRLAHVLQDAFTRGHFRLVDHDGRLRTVGDVTVSGDGKRAMVYLKPGRGDPVPVERKAPRKRQTGVVEGRLRGPEAILGKPADISDAEIPF